MPWFDASWDPLQFQAGSPVSQLALARELQRWRDAARVQHCPQGSAVEPRATPQLTTGVPRQPTTTGVDL